MIREHVQEDVTIVSSVTDAIARFGECQPDVIVAPTLLSPLESDQLISYVKRHAGPHVQMLTIPALDILREPMAEAKSGLGFFRWRRPVSLGLQYDPGAVGRQIADRLERARAVRAEQKASPSPQRLVSQEISRAIRPVQKPAEKATPLTQDRRWAHRTPQRGMPWLWTVRLPWGTDVDLVNISRSGVLIESGSKVSPGVTLELHLNGPGLNRVVMARFVRSEIARVDHLGVRYHAAAQFEQPIDILAPRVESTPRSTPQSLVDLLTTVLSDSNQPEAASVRFARSLRALIGARDVLIRHAPIAPPDDSESIYFHVKGDGASRRILQVMFERDRALTAAEFTLLKAAAGLTTAVLELERPSPEDMRPLAAVMSEVA